MKGLYLFIPKGSLMRLVIISLALLAAGCSKPQSESTSTDSAQSSESMESGNVGISQLPGISLSYQYGFLAPIERLGVVQEQHAAQCEALTPVRCRITGMSYEVRRDRTIAASLQLKLAPEIARRFGKQSIDTVVKQGGMLTNAAIDSEETGAVKDAVDRDMTAITAERARISEQLTKPGLSAAERTQLQYRLTELSNEARQSQAIRSEATLKLASTPMTFNYRSGNVDPGLTDGPILGAIKDGWTNIVSGFALILMLLITLMPWIASLLLVIWLWRRFGARLGLNRDADA